MIDEKTATSPSPMEGVHLPNVLRVHIGFSDYTLSDVQGALGREANKAMREVEAVASAIGYTDRYEPDLIPTNLYLPKLSFA